MIIVSFIYVYLFLFPQIDIFFSLEELIYNNLITSSFYIIPKRYEHEHIGFYNKIM